MTIITFLLTALLAMQGVDQTQQKPPVISLAISSMQDVIKAHAQVTVETVLTNISDHEISTFQGSGSAQGYDVVVRDAQGKPPRSASDYLAEQAKKDRDAGRPFRAIIRQGSAHTVQLKPGQNLKDRIEISAFYDLSQPGKYTIQVSRKDPESKTDVNSNMITVTLTP